MEKYLSKKTPFERLLIVGGSLWLAAKILDSIILEYDTCNYTLYNKKRVVYHGVAYEDRLDNRLYEHELAGKVFDDCVYDEPKPRPRALKLERKRIKRDQPKYNIQHKN